VSVLLCTDTWFSMRRFRRFLQLGRCGTAPQVHKTELLLYCELLL